MPQPLNILHVEDNPHDVKIVERELKRSGLEAHLRRVDTEPAFLQGLQGDLDLILSDYTMPEFSGLRALELLKESGLELPLIIVSGSIGEDLAVEAMKHGAADYLLKDRLARLGPTVRLALEQKRLRKERLQIQEDLRGSEERFRQFAENISEVMWISSADLSTILYVSPSYEKVWGRTCLSLYQNPRSFVESIHEEDRRGVATAMEAYRRGAKFDLEYRIVRPDGQIRWIHARGNVIRNEAGIIHRLGAIAEDITRRKQSEQQFRQAQKMEGIGQLASGVAHDFNNLLMIIGINLELLLMTEKNLDPKSKEHLADIASAADRATTLNRQLLVFSRNEAMQMKVLDLNELTASFSKMLRRVVGATIQLQNQLAPALPFIKADPGMVEQVLMNLALNARDAMPRGGQLVIATEQVVIDPARAELDPRVRPGHFACLSVRDTGTGIAPENMSRIFEPFFTTKGAGKGTGLGLATVFGIAEQHKGWVDVSSEVGTGTTFRVFWPLSAEGAPASDLAISQKVRGGHERVLVVEDEGSLRGVVLQTLENLGYAVTEADSGLSAQKIWAEQGGQFDLLMTDMVMPGRLTGLELAGLLRAQKPALKVVLTSGYSAELTGDDPMRGKNIAFLRKPFSIPTMAETIRKCLDAD